MAKIFFTSYAHRNLEPYLERFVDDLSRHVLAQMAEEEADEVAFFDLDKLEDGDYFRAKLAAEISTCRACVAICTPAFVASRFCGKELRIFLERLRRWELQNAVVTEARRPLFPVLWVTVPIPSPLDRFHRRGEFTGVYAEKGLRTMYALKRHAEARKELVLNLAERIVAVTRAINLPEEDPARINFDHITSAFDGEETPVRNGVALLPLVKGGLHGELPGAGSLHKLVGDLFGHEIPWRVIDQSRDLVRSLDGAHEGGEVTVVLADPETLASPIVQAQLAAIDGVLRGPAAVVVMRLDPAEAAGSQDPFPRARGRGVLVDDTPAASTVAFAARLHNTVLALRRRLMQNATAAPARDQRLEAQAARAGLRIDRRPVVQGPGTSPS